MARSIAPPPYRGIVFDCDSTLATIEGIEALAEDADESTRAKIAALTEDAMQGRIPLEAAYGARLEALCPSRADVARIGALYIEHVLPNARALVQGLLALHKRVFIVSGGLLEPVQALGEHLGIPREQAFAVDVRFDEQGRYAGFDEDCPLARAGGKLELMRPWQAEHGPLALIGDGATDLEAAPACARFIAFAGVHARPHVVAAADAVCEHADLAALLPLLCSPAEQDQLASLPHHAPLVQAAHAFV